MLHLAPWPRFWLETHSSYTEETRDINININKLLHWVSETHPAQCRLLITLRTTLQRREMECRQAKENRRGLECLQFSDTHLFNSEALTQGTVQGVPLASEARSVAYLQVFPPLGGSLDSQILWRCLAIGFGVKENEASSSQLISVGRS